MTGLERLHAVLVAEGEPLAGVLESEPPGGGGGGHASAAADGPRTKGHPAEYEFLVEAIYEGYLLHYATSRLLAGADPDFALLAGDRLYALGLERLVALDDLPAVCELADVIALCALLCARGEGDLCEMVWACGARAVASGASAEHQRVKSLLRRGDPGAGAALAALTAHGGFP